MDAGAPTLGPFAIPGDPEALQGLASKLRLAASQVADIRSRVERNGLHGSWSGRAADAFRSSLQELPGELDKLYSSFTVAADAVRTYAVKMEDLQSRATWLAGQLQQAQSAMREAQMRQQSAEHSFQTAVNQRNSAADPATEASAQRALESAAKAMASAGADHEESSAKGQSLMGSAEINYGEFRSAANVCAQELRIASQLGIQNSFFKPIGDFLGGVAGDVGGVARWTVGEIGKGVEDVGHLAGHVWHDVRAVLEDLKKPLEIVGAVALVVGAAGAVILQPESAPLMFALVEGATSTSTVLTEATLGIDATETAGDAAVAVVGDQSDRAEAQQDIGGDILSTVGDRVGLHGALTSDAKLAELAGKEGDAAMNYLDTGTSQYLGWATRYHSQYTAVLKDASNPLQGAGLQYLNQFDQQNLRQLFPGSYPAPTATHKVTLPPAVSALGVN